MPVRGAFGSGDGEDEFVCGPPAEAERAVRRREAERLRSDWSSDWVADAS